MAIDQFDVLKVVVSLTMPGDTIAQNVFYCEYLGGTPADESDVTDDCEAWVVLMYANIISIMAIGVDVNEIKVYLKTSAAPLEYDLIGVAAGTQSGTAVTDPLPNGVALVMRAGTILAKTVARKYIAGLSEAQAAGAAWVAAAVIDATAFAVDWIVGPPTVAGRSYQGGVVSSKDGLFKAFTAAAVISSIPGYQRRRKPGVGI